MSNDPGGPRLRILKVTSGRTIALQAGLAALSVFELGSAFHQVDIGREGTPEGLDGLYRLTGYSDIGEKFLIDVHIATAVRTPPFETYGGMAVLRSSDGQATYIGRVVWIHKPGSGFECGEVT